MKKRIKILITEHEDAEGFDTYVAAYFARIYVGFEVEVEQGIAFKAYAIGSDNDDDMEEEIAALMPDAWERFCAAILVSIDNGLTLRAADDLTDAEIDQHWGAFTQAMHDATREAMHVAHAPCSNREFLTHYLGAAPWHLVIG